jgi:hypothetical protein
VRVCDVGWQAGSGGHRDNRDMDGLALSSLSGDVQRASSRVHLFLLPTGLRVLASTPPSPGRPIGMRMVVRMRMRMHILFCLPPR